MCSLYLCAIVRVCGVSNPRTRKSVDMYSLEAASLRSEYMRDLEFRKMLFRSKW